MVLAPNYLFSWNNNTMRRNPRMGMLHYCCTMHNDTHSVNNSFLKPWWGHLPCSQTFLRLLSSPVRTQLMLIVRCWGPGPPHPKSGVPTPGVRAHSPPRVRNRNNEIVKLRAPVHRILSGHYMYIDSTKLICVVFTCCFINLNGWWPFKLNKNI